MPQCPVCNSEQVIYSPQPRYQVEGRPTALCPHTEAHAREGMGPHPVRFFADTGDLVRPASRLPWEVLYAAGIPLDIQEEGRRFSGAFLDEYAGIRGLTKSVVNQLTAAKDLVGLLPSLKVMDEGEREGWPVLMAPLFGEAGFVGIELRYFCRPPTFRPGDPPPKGPGRLIRTHGMRGLYLTDPFSSPRVIVVFEGIWDAVAARWDAFEQQNGEFVFAGMTANSSAESIRAALRRYYPGVPVVVVPDRDRPGIQAMARLRRWFPGVVLSGLNGPEGNGPKDYREAPRDTRWPALLAAVEEGVSEWERRKLGNDPLGRREIVVRPPECDLVKESLEVLEQRGGFYVRGQAMVYVWKYRRNGKTSALRIPQGSPVIREANPPWLREQISRCARFVKENQEGQTRDCLIPDWLPPMVLASSKLQALPMLQALVEVPVLLPDGNVLEEPGLDPESGIFYAPRCTFEPIPDSPTQEEAKVAAQRLCELVVDFPFAERPRPEAHRAAWLAFLLTGFARYAIPGPVPFVLLEANGPASGKGLLAQVTGQIILGRALPVSAAPADGEELQKHALAMLRDGLRMALLDEVPTPFGSRQFNALVTAYPTYEGRLLGQSKTLQVPQLTLWIAAGNNVVLAADAVRRCLHIRLEPQVERPEDRSGFRIPDLEKHVRNNQADLATAALTILRAYCLAGRPSFGLRPWGSFQEWSDLVRNAVYWVLGVDCDTRDALAERADSTRAAQASLICALQGQFELEPFTTEQVMELYLARDARNSELFDAIDELNVNPKGVSSGSLGRILLRAIGAVFGGWRLDLQPTKRTGSRVWIIRRVAAQEDPKGFGGNHGSNSIALGVTHTPLRKAVGSG